MVAPRCGISAIEAPASPSSSNQRFLWRRSSWEGIGYGSIGSKRRRISSHASVYAVSDLHTDYRENLQWIVQLSTKLHQRDTLIVAGDVSDNLETFKDTMRLLKERFHRVFFVPGNHDLWCRGKENKHLDSLGKLRELNAICESLCIDTKPGKVCGVWIVPLLSWYHQTFDKERDIVGYNIPPPEKRCTDYHACKWPDELKTPDIALAAYFDDLNSCNQQCLTEIRHSTERVITFSHFLPRPELCPEKRMLFYPNLPKVIGSDFLERRLRSIHGSSGNSGALHVFGHTHFSWDATVDGIRYLQAPLAYPRERRRRVYGGECWLPLCIYDSEGTLLPRPMPCYWSDYYRLNKRDPDNVVLAPWVADLYCLQKS
ncbi:uncharacterized protein LOC9648112 isoform X2 [Selaginella moellendorffii]|uniref:uncharacterized protein LOC9648112 isoform X2 n=1 Tax=Selaginella moellendorffii TaxID=88036 RepID=UPI000D1CAE58|nr:uncharacterized protein LOC9648112 isoform X2 [Selaginella moellendorffii]|eukprot:XP_024542337.1 uncharacterized protein LOC9648112 isoform X2 [Selaginella moellendorffii]